jgi:hypothetical protein
MSLAGDMIPKRRGYRVRFIEDRDLSYDTRKAVLDVQGEGGGLEEART